MTVAGVNAVCYDPADLVAAKLAALPRPLLLCTDVDGTLSTIAPTPGEARLLDGAHEALDQLVALGVEVAAVSGRSVRELVDQFALPATVVLVGSHGVEVEVQAAPTAEEAELLSIIGATFDGIAARYRGAMVERKPFAVALHVRRCDGGDGFAALMAAERATAELDGARAVVGHLVHEAVVRHTTKVEAVASLRQRSAAAAVIYIGDDQSDERVFASFTDLGDVAVGIKVGPGESVAQHRLEDPAAVVEVLQQLAVRLQK